jgi:hypothetical protein
MCSAKLSGILAKRLAGTSGRAPLQKHGLIDRVLFAEMAAG